MSDEFDDTPEPLPIPPPLRRAAPPVGPAAARLAARLYASANGPLRARLLACLLRPLGPLATAGVAAGAFAGYLYRGSAAEGSLAEDAARFSNEEIAELARFAWQVDPQALWQFAALVSDNAMGFAAFSAAALWLLYRRLRSAAPGSEQRALDLREAARDGRDVDGGAKLALDL
jgi:hypothetical protein